MAVPAIEQKFMMQAPERPEGHSGSIGNTQVNVPAEAYETYTKIIDPDAIYLNKLSRLLWNCYLVKSEEFDPRSPVPGYKLIEIGGATAKKMMSWEGYNTITNNFVMLVSEAISTSEFDQKDLNLRKVCFDGVWAIICQLVANWDVWEFDDPNEIMTLGIEMWFNMYAVSRRSNKGGFMHFLTDIFKHLGNNRRAEDEERHKVKFWGRPQQAR